MPGYTLVPGTNQLVYAQPGMGSQLFNQYGYNIDRPRWRDYYNMLRGNQGLDFATALAGLLTKIWPTGPHATGAAVTKPAAVTIPAVTAAAVTKPAFTSPVGLLPMGNASWQPNINNVLNKSIATNEQSSSFSGWNNNQQWPGPDPMTRLHAYHELLRHAEMMDMRDRDPRLFVTNQYLLPGQFFEVPGGWVENPDAALGVAPGPSGGAPAVMHDSFFSSHKKMIIGVAIAITALVVYFKILKK